jgi:hypothetical protein
MIYECVYCIKEKQMQKESHTGTKPLLKISSFVVALNVVYGVVMCAGGPALPGGGGEED